MGRKIFISYKYADNDVKKITDNYYSRDTVRDYVDILEVYLKEYSEHIYKGESNGEDLSRLSDYAIWEKLKDRIYDSTLTIVIISPNMKESYKRERDQWIPWEISYSLKEITRRNRSGGYFTSGRNAFLAIVLPDYNGKYDYFTYSRSCCSSMCRHLNTNILFNILKRNMFNVKKENTKVCNDGSKIYYGDYSYIESVKWSDFIENIDEYINTAYRLNDKISEYDLCLEV